MGFHLEFEQTQRVLCQYGWDIDTICDAYASAFGEYPIRENLRYQTTLVQESASIGSLPDGQFGIVIQILNGVLTESFMFGNIPFSFGTTETANFVGLPFNRVAGVGDLFIIYALFKFV